MAALRRTVHPRADIGWAPLKQLCPDIKLELTRPDGKTEEPWGLLFTDPDGEQHVYVFAEQGRQNLLRHLTGGLILPGPPA